MEKIRSYGHRHFRRHVDALPECERKPLMAGIRKSSFNKSEPEFFRSLKGWQFNWNNLVIAAIVVIAIVAIGMQLANRNPEADEFKTSADLEVPNSNGSLKVGASIMPDNGKSLVRNSNDAYFQLHTPWGTPGHELVLHRASYSMEYDIKNQIARWVAFKVQPDGNQSSPQHSFDELIDKEVQRADSYYEGTIYQRGSLIPTILVRGAEHIEDTEYWSVVYPQLKGFMHRRLALHREIKKISGSVNVVLGPILADGLEKNGELIIPNHYFYVITREHNGQLECRALITSMKDNKSVSFDSQLCSVDEIEEKTGLDFFSNLSERDQNRLENKPAQFLKFR